MVVTGQNAEQGAPTLDFRSLRDLLANLYEFREDAQVILDDVGLDASRVTFTNSRATWSSILREARKQGLVDAIVKAAFEDYPNQQLLVKAAEVSLDGRLGPRPRWRWEGSRASLERILGESDLRGVEFLEKGARAARSVARICHGGRPIGTGFLTRGDYLVTCHHVISTPEDAAQATAEFGVRYDPPSSGTPYSLDPDGCFATSAYQGGDDWTIVRVAGAPSAQWGGLVVDASRLEVGQRVSIIQHPAGRRQEVALHDNRVMYADDRRVQYLTDTLPGSSGAPVFDLDWRVRALHHSGGYIPEPGTSREVFRNQGIAGRIVSDALSQAVEPSPTQ